MATKLSRRKLAGNAAARFSSGENKKAILQELAAYLIDTNRKKEAELIVRDIEAMLADAGTAIGTVISARPLSSDAVSTVESFVKAQNAAVKTVVLRERIDKTLIGGVRLELPGHQLDASVKAKLEQLTV